MIDTIIYYLGRISVFWRIFIPVVFFFAVMLNREKYLDKVLNKTQAVYRTVFAPYFVFILVLTIFIRLPNNNFNFELVLFWSYREIIKNHDTELLIQNLYNIVIFVPFGFVVPQCGYKLKNKTVSVKETILFGAGFSLIIETVQLISKVGYFEFDDIFHNIAGVALGAGIFILLRKIKRRNTYYFKRNEK